MTILFLDWEEHFTLETNPLLQFETLPKEYASIITNLWNLTISVRNSIDCESLIFTLQNRPCTTKEAFNVTHILIRSHSKRFFSFKHFIPRSLSPHSSFFQDLNSRSSHLYPREEIEWNVSDIIQIFIQCLGIWTSSSARRTTLQNPFLVSNSLHLSSLSLSNFFQCTFLICSTLNHCFFSGVHLIV